ncbi:hypothetical protein GCM10007421_10880 [Halopseudomonas oceani]|nr:hypothetical protein GCM10007421_10880 [Halopseudomonas oceani]
MTPQCYRALGFFGFLIGLIDEIDNAGSPDRAFMKHAETLYPTNGNSVNRQPAATAYTDHKTANKGNPHVTAGNPSERPVATRLNKRHSDHRCEPGHT